MTRMPPLKRGTEMIVEEIDYDDHILNMNRKLGSNVECEK
jgi:hypothetical protein